MITSPWLCCKFYHPPGLIYRLKRVSFDGDGHRCSDPTSAFVRRYDFGFGEAAVLPGYGYFKSASCAESPYAAGLPGGREGRQQVHAIRVALEQHFCHTGRRAKVAVYLERRVGVEQVGVGAPAFGILRVGAAHQLHLPANYAVRVVPILRTGQDVDLPAHGPARTLISPECQGLHGGAKQIRCSILRDLITGVHPPEVRDVAVGALGVIDVLQPFLKLSMPADPVADRGKVRGLSVLKTARRRSLVSSRSAMNSGSRWPSTGRPKASMTSGYGLPGPGPINRRSLCPMWAHRSRIFPHSRESFR